MIDPRGPTLFEMARQALSSTDEGYNLLAPKFEHSIFRTGDYILDPIAEILGPPGSIRHAIDLCCGTGAAIRMLRPLCTESITGIDRCAGMIEQAEEQLRDAPGDARVRLVQGDALEINFDEQFDLATTFGSLGHMLSRQQDRLARRVWSALKPGGRFAFVTATRPSWSSPRMWAYRAFNGLMDLRNALLDPPFVMYYLTFPVDRAREVLSRHGFDVRVHSPYRDQVYSWLKVVVATKPY